MGLFKTINIKKEIVSLKGIKKMQLNKADID
jgi:hypothetical protein